MLRTPRRRTAAAAAVTTLALVTTVVVLARHHHDDRAALPVGGLRPAAGAVGDAQQSSYLADDSHWGLLRPVGLLTASQTRHLTSTPWTLQSVTAQGLWVDYGSDSCTLDRGFYVRETATAVLVGHYVHERADGVTCLDYSSPRGHGMVPLRRPLGSRTLEHVAVQVRW